MLFISVHFEEKEGHTIAHVVDNEKGEEEEILGGKTTEESMNEIVDAQKRILDQWCFAEHYEPKVLLQVSHITQKWVFGDFQTGKIQTSLLSFRAS